MAAWGGPRSRVACRGGLAGRLDGRQPGDYLSLAARELLHIPVAAPAPRCAVIDLWSHEKTIKQRNMAEHERIPVPVDPSHHHGPNGHAFGAPVEYPEPEPEDEIEYLVYVARAGAFSLWDHR